MPGLAALALALLVVSAAVGGVAVSRRLATDGAGGDGPAMRTAGDGLLAPVPEAGARAPEPAWSVDLGIGARVLQAAQPEGSVVLSWAPRYEVGPVTLTVLDAADGRVRWSADLRLGAAHRWVVAGDTVVVGGDDDRGRPRLVGYALADGVERWVHPVGGAGLAAPVVAPLHPDTVLVAIPTMGWVKALDPGNGRIRWTQEADEFVVVPTGEVALATASTVTLVERLGGRVRWRHQTGGQLNAALVAAEQLVLVSLVRQVQAIRLDGELRWSIAATEPVRFAADLGGGRLALGGRRHGRVVDAATGRVRQELGSIPLAAVRQGGDGWLLASEGRRTVVLAARAGRLVEVGLAEPTSDLAADAGDGGRRLGAQLPGPPDVRRLLADVVLVPEGPSVVAYELDGLRLRWAVAVPGSGAGARVDVVASGPQLIVHDGASQLVALR